jgi:phage baseplate assembly protein V
LNNIKYAKTVEAQKDNKNYPIVTVTYLERIGNVATCENYGMHSSPPIGTPCLMFTVNNDEANRIVIPLSASIRTKNLKESEAEFGNMVVGSIITFDSEGNINIKSKNNINIDADGAINVITGSDITVEAGGDINIEAGGGDINIEGDIHVTGDIDTTGDVVAGTISLKDHLHGLVTSGTEESGPPVP